MAEITNTIEMLHYAREGAGRWDAIKAFLARHAVSQKDLGELLRYVCIKGDLSNITYLLDTAKVHVDEPDNEGHTSLGFAAAFGHYACVKSLVEHGADVNKLDVHGHGPLFAAVDRNQREIALYLIEKGANPHQQDVADHMTPLDWARKRGRQDLVDAINHALASKPA